MKTVILALLVLVVVSQGEALKCSCKGAGCEVSCSGSNEVCATLFFVFSYNVNSIQGCMDANYCRLLGKQATFPKCCDWDLCNR